MIFFKILKFKKDLEFNHFYDYVKKKCIQIKKINKKKSNFGWWLGQQIW